MRTNSIQNFFKKPFFNSEKQLIRIYLIVCVLISLKIVFLETCDNYDCFKASWFHLIGNLDLYLMYPQEYHTEYNYSPFFAFMMGAFAYFPNGVGIVLWNIVNTIPFLVAVHLLPVSTRNKVFLLWFCLVEFITAAESVQTNSNVAAFIMLVLIYQQKEKTTWSAFFLVFGFFFKIYVLTAGVFFLCYNKKGSFILKSIGWALVFLGLPLLVVSPDQLLFLYQSWIARLQAQSERNSMSIIGVIGDYFPNAVPQAWIVLTGTFAMLLVLLKKEVYRNLQFRLLYLAGILLFTVVFNPGVESPSYIIGVAGVALWYTNKDRQSWHGWIMVLVFVFTCLSPTEVFPGYIKDHFLKPWHVKAIPCIIVWFICMYELYIYKPGAITGERSAQIN
ncbi:MAG: glycosyltransferase family 87 protein [Sediminibacterium sp.]